MPLNTSVRLGRRYVADAEIDKRRDSALRLIQQTLAMRDLLPRHHREMISIGLWKWTEAVGVTPYAKFHIPFRSLGALDMTTPALINHEHVWSRRWIVDELLQRQEWTDELLRTFLEAYGVACIVTVEEHGRLGASRANGWARYVDAGVRVRDMRTDEEVDRTALTEATKAQAVSGLEDEEDEAPGGLTMGKGLETVLAQLTNRAAPRVRALVQALEDETIVLMPGLTRAGAIAENYFRIHDAVVEEPTPAVAYVHYGGLVSLRLNESNIPQSFADMDEVSLGGHPRYGADCRLVDNTSVEVADELIRLALEQIRTEETL